MIVALLITMCVFSVITMALFSADAYKLPIWLSMLVAIMLCIGYVMTVIVLYNYAGIVQ
jgi:hypothetical protein